METPVGHGRVRLKLYGRRPFGGREQPLSARVFARKLTTLLNAITAADRAVNGARRFEHFITRLKEGSGLIELEETKLPKVRKSAASSVEAFDYCMSAVQAGNRQGALRWGRCSEYIQRLAEGTDEDFGYGELWVNGRESPFRIDDFLEEQSLAIIAPEQIDATDHRRRWFKGAAYGSFDGSIKVLDFRGALPLVTLTLSAGGKEIDCVLPGMTEDDLAPVMNKRALVQGIAYYDGRSALPRRIEVRAPIRAIRTNVDFTKWKGAFDPFDAEIGAFDQ